MSYRQSILKYFHISQMSFKNLSKSTENVDVREATWHFFKNLTLQY